jgi:hypothetical protein
MKKKIIAIGFGIGISIFISIIISTINILLGWNLESLSFFIVIPIGGLVLGFLGSSGYFLGKKFTNLKSHFTDYIIVVLLGLLTLFNVNYISYNFTFVSLDKNVVEVTTSFKQSHNHTHLKDLISFNEYIELNYSSLEYSFVARRDKKVSLGKFPTTFLFYLQLLGAIIGAVGLGLLLKKSRYCDTCKVYFKKIPLNTIDYFNYDIISKITNNRNFDSKFLYSKIIGLPEFKGKSGKYVSISLSYCPSCFESLLEMEFYHKHKDSTQDELENVFIIEFDKNVTNTIVK